MRASAMTDHGRIREWIEARGGHPARMRSGTIRIDFGKSANAVEDISWDEFFRVFDESRDAFLHHDNEASRH